MHGRSFTAAGHLLATPASRRQALTGLATLTGAVALGATPRRVAGLAPGQVVDFTRVYGQLTVSAAQLDQLPYYPMEMFLTPAALSLYMPPGVTELPQGWSASVVGRWVMSGSGNTIAVDTVARFDVYGNSSEAKAGYQAVEDALLATGTDAGELDRFATFATGPRSDAIRRVANVVVHVTETLAEGADSTISALLAPVVEALGQYKVDLPIDRSLFVAPGAVVIDLTVDRFAGQTLPSFGWTEEATALLRGLAGDADIHWSAVNSFPLPDGTFVGLQQHLWDFGEGGEQAAKAHHDAFADLLADFDVITGTQRSFLEASNPLVPSPQDLGVDAILVDLFAAPSGDNFVFGAEVFLLRGTQISSVSFTDQGHPDALPESLDQKWTYEQVAALARILTEDNYEPRFPVGVTSPQADWEALGRKLFGED